MRRQTEKQMVRRSFATPGFVCLPGTTQVTENSGFSFEFWRVSSMMTKRGNQEVTPRR